MTAGTYEGRSPDALAIAGTTPVTTDVGGGMEVPWPSSSEATTKRMSVPLAFVGRGVRDRRLPSDVGLDQIAPTLEPLLGIERPHPEVRAGTAITGVVQTDARTPLVVLVVWKGVGDADVTRSFQHLLQRSGGSTNVPRLHEAVGIATAGSLPLDPVAVETTIGSGGLPSQHGITGTSIRSPQGRVVAAFGTGSPPPVIASLGDDLDRATAGVTKIGLIDTAIGDAALTGDEWYGTGPVIDRRVHAEPDLAGDVDGFLQRGWGANRVPDLLAVAIDGSASRDAARTGRLFSAIYAAVPDAVVVQTATGSVRSPSAVKADAPAGTDVLVAGGAFVDRGTGSTATAQDVVDGFRATTGPDGVPLFTDAFASYAVRFGRYC